MQQQSQQQPTQGRANVEPPPGYVRQSLPEGNQLNRVLTYPQGDPMGFAFILFWVVVFGVYIALWAWGESGGFVSKPRRGV